MLKAKAPREPAVRPPRRSRPECNTAPRAGTRPRRDAAAPPADAEGGASRAPIERKLGGFALPPLALLDAPRTERKIDERELMDGARHLEEKCREFSVEGAVVQIHPGPVVTTYEFKPDAGVKYSKITGSPTTCAWRCRPSPCSSIACRASPPSASRFRTRTARRSRCASCSSREPYARSASKLSLALGKTIHGEPFIADLAVMPHLLIAGSTGTGKSVGLNAHAHQRPLPRDARRRAADHDRPEAPRARDVRGHPAPAHAGRRRPEAGLERAAVGGARDGRALQDARGRRRAQHRAVQPQHAAA